MHFSVPTEAVLPAIDRTDTGLHSSVVSEIIPAAVKVEPPGLHFIRSGVEIICFAFDARKIFCRGTGSLEIISLFGEPNPHRSEKSQEKEKEFSDKEYHRYTSADNNNNSI